MTKRTFPMWKLELDRVLINLCGLSSDDLPDCSYYDWYDQGYSPKVAAKKAIKSAKEY